MDRGVSGCMWSRVAPAMDFISRAVLLWLLLVGDLQANVQPSYHGFGSPDAGQLQMDSGDEPQPVHQAHSYWLRPLLQPQPQVKPEPQAHPWLQPEPPVKLEPQSQPQKLAQQHSYWYHFPSFYQNVNPYLPIPAFQSYVNAPNTPSQPQAKPQQLLPQPQPPVQYQLWPQLHPPPQPHAQQHGYWYHFPSFHPNVKPYLAISAFQSNFEGPNTQPQPQPRLQQPPLQLEPQPQVELKPQPKPQPQPRPQHPPLQPQPPPQTKPQQPPPQPRPPPQPKPQQPPPQPQPQPRPPPQPKPQQPPLQPQPQTKPSEPKPQPQLQQPQPQLKPQQLLPKPELQLQFPPHGQMHQYWHHIPRYHPNVKPFPQITALQSDLRTPYIYTQPQALGYTQSLQMQAHKPSSPPLHMPGFMLQPQAPLPGSQPPYVHRPWRWNQPWPLFQMTRSQLHPHYDKFSSQVSSRDRAFHHSFHDEGGLNAQRPQEVQDFN